MLLNQSSYCSVTHGFKAVRKWPEIQKICRVCDVVDGISLGRDKHGLIYLRPMTSSYLVHAGFLLYWSGRQFTRTHLTIVTHAGGPAASKVSEVVVFSVY